MIIKLMLESEKPLYQQLKEKIIYALAVGELKEGELLPSVRQLASSLSINMHTVNKAYNQLADEGFLTMHKGKGAAVNPPKVYRASEREVEEMEENLTVVGAEAMCRSVDKETFLKMCRKAYEDIERDKK